MTSLSIDDEQTDPYFLHPSVSHVHSSVLYLRIWVVQRQTPNTHTHSVLTPDSGRPGAVVEDGELSEHFARPHRAQLHPLFGHLHLPLWARDSQREKERENTEIYFERFQQEITNRPCRRHAQSRTNSRLITRHKLLIDKQQTSFHLVCFCFMILLLCLFLMIY